MANSERQIRTPEPRPGAQPQQIAGVVASVLDAGYLLESYARLYKHKPKNASGAGYPNPMNLTTIDALVRAISNWMMAEGDPDSSARCDKCHGPMDLSLVKDKVVPEKCIFCGDGPIVWSEDEETEEEDDEPEETEEEGDEPDEEPPAVASDDEDDAAPESGKVAASTTKKKVKKVAAKKKESKSDLLPGEKVDLKKKDGKVAAKAKDGKLVKASEAKSEVVDKETRSLLDGIETVRKGLVGATQGVYDEMWKAGKWLAEVQKSKAWQKHPNDFRVWKDFVEGVFGVLVNVKRVEELITFYRSNPKEIPKLAGPLRFALPKVRNPQPKSPREKDGETGPQHDPNYISFAGMFKKRLKIAFITEGGKPAKSLKQRPVLVIPGENGVTIKVSINNKPDGTLVGVVTFDRES